MAVISVKADTEDRMRLLYNSAIQGSSYIFPEVEFERSKYISTITSCINSDLWAYAEN